MSTGIEAPVAAEPRLAEAIELLRGTRIAVLTGAGVSTDSGIPDYRGEGAPVRTPMTVQSFLASERARKRYWAGSHLGWRNFASAAPNRGHLALAELEARGHVNGVITQNVDGLHRRAGNQHVIELHGSMDRVLCLTCGQRFARQAIAARLETLNPEIDLETAIRPAPDGDVEVDDVDAMVIPACTVCGGILKPDVVFFGEFVPADVFQAAASLVQGRRRSARGRLVARRELGHAAHRAGSTQAPADHRGQSRRHQGRRPGGGQDRGRSERDARSHRHRARFLTTATG